MHELHPVHTHNTHLHRVPSALHDVLMTNPYRHFVHYAALPGVVLDTIECRACRTPLATLAPDPRLVKQRKAADGTVIHEIGYLLQQTNRYAELPLEMRELSGALSLHVMTLCKTCVAKPWTSDQLAELYAADIDQWGVADEVAGVDPEHTRTFLNRMIWRQVANV